MARKNLNFGTTFILKSKPEKNNSLSCIFPNNIELSEEERWGIRLIALSCPMNEEETSVENEENINVLSVSTPNVEQNGGEGILSVQAQSHSENTNAHHQWIPEHICLPLSTCALSGLTLNLKPGKLSHPQPSLAIVKMERLDDVRREIVFHATSKNSENPQQFQIELPKDATFQNDKDYQIALASITLNPFFTPLPYTFGKENRYGISWTPLGGVTRYIFKTIEELFPKTARTTFSKIWHLLNAFLADPNQEGGAICFINTPMPIDGNPEPASIHISWNYSGRIQLPWPILYLLGWKEGIAKLSSGTYLHLDVTRGEQQVFTPNIGSASAFQPKNLMIEADCIPAVVVGDSMRKVLCAMPIETLADNANDYVTYKPAELEFHPLLFTGEKTFSVALKTPENNFASFGDVSSIVYLSFILQIL